MCPLYISGHEVTIVFFLFLMFSHNWWPVTSLPKKTKCFLHDVFTEQKHGTSQPEGWQFRVQRNVYIVRSLCRWERAVKRCSELGVAFSSEILLGKNKKRFPGLERWLHILTARTGETKGRGVGASLGGWGRDDGDDWKCSPRAQASDVQTKPHANSAIP